MKTYQPLADKRKRPWTWEVGFIGAYKRILAPVFLLFLDGMAITLSMLLSYFARSMALPVLFPSLFNEQLLARSVRSLWWLPVILVITLAYEELYYKRLPFWLELERILKACMLALFFSVTFLYITKTGAETSRTLWIASWLLVLLLIPLLRYTGKRTLGRLGIWERPILVLGAGKTGKLLAKALSRERTLGYKIIGVLDDNDAISGLSLPDKTDKIIPRLGSFQDAQEIIRCTGVEDVVIAAPGLEAEKLVKLVNSLQPQVHNIMVVPDLFGLSLNGIEAEYFLDEQLLLLNIRNRLKSAFNRAVKRIFDLVFGLTILLIALPFMAVIALAIKIESRGPVLFLQKRIGQNGKTFTCLKFRTMHTNSEKILRRYLKRSGQARKEWQKYNKLRAYDPRVTRVGAFLRRYSLDELPQILNIIAGDMSLVGPRPYLLREKAKIKDYLYDILVTKPGLTGLWQVSGRNNIDFAGRLKLDVWYVRNWSLWLDLVLLLRTIGVVLKREGAY